MRRAGRGKGGKWRTVASALQQAAAVTLVAFVVGWKLSHDPAIAMAAATVVGLVLGAFLLSLGGAKGA